MDLNCKSIYLTIRSKQTDSCFVEGEIYSAKNKCVFKGITFDNASDDLRFDINLENRNIYTKKGRVLNQNISKKTLVKNFDIIKEEYGEDELMIMDI